MRLAIDFATEGELPLAYRLLAISILKEAVKAGGGEAYNKVYVDGAKMPKPYTFAVRFLGQFEVQQVDVVKTNGFRLLVSSSDYEFLIPLLNGLQNQRIFQYQTYRFTRQSIQFLREVETDKSVIIVHTLSPVLIQDKYDRPLAPDDLSYNVNLTGIMNGILQSHLERRLYQPLCITPVNSKKTVIKEKYDKSDHHRTIFFTAYGGVFQIEGHPADLNYVLMYGLGLRSSQGFGMLELVKVVK